MLVTAESYERLRLWLRSMVALTMPDIEADSEIDPVRVLDGFPKAKAREGLALAIGDMVEMTNDWSPSRIAVIDRQLLEDGLPSLSEIQMLSGKAVARIIRRGTIKTDAEYYLARNVAELSSEHQEKLLALIEVYKAR
ncbi:hypothetical protein [Brevundimonas sp.]|uniref:hypothetical protein n=1 Tax=Brevundimonas sp. TaxID=1871086 RepID=UPI0025C5F734|nr:hypothetical protein [Brevundimonas sp.]